MENRVHVIAEVSGSSPLPPTITYSRQNSQAFLLVIVRRYRESVSDSPFIPNNLDFLYEALNKCLSL